MIDSIQVRTKHFMCLKTVMTILTLPAMLLPPITMTWNKQASVTFPPPPYQPWDWYCLWVFYFSEMVAY